MTDRTHVSRNGLSQIEPRNQKKGEMKPEGFWYEVAGDWRRWCESEMPDWVSGHDLYKVNIGSGVKMLTIADPGEFSTFHRKYATVRPYSGSSILYPDWPRLVAEGYDGIEIAPYMWEFRMPHETFWYYSWDCASGCIWTPKDTTVELIERLPEEARRD